MILYIVSPWVLYGTDAYMYCDSLNDGRMDEKHISRPQLNILPYANSLFFS